MTKPSVYFYGRLAGATKREAERAARDAGYRLASELNDALELIVLGEGEPLAEVRTRLAKEFDAMSREVFESGKLELIAESEFYRRALDRVLHSQDALDDESSASNFSVNSQNVAKNNENIFASDKVSEQGYTPAAIAELAGVSIATIRRWRQRELLTPIDSATRLPRFSTREVLVARRLAFLCSTGLSEELITKRLIAFLNVLNKRVASETTFKTLSDDSTPLFAFEKSETPFVGPDSVALTTNERKIADVILSATLSTDGRDILYLSESGPTDVRGQRRFDFTAIPTDGSLEKPDAVQLSEEEEQIALAERLAAWNEATTQATGRPAFLDMFGHKTETKLISDSELNKIEDEISNRPQTVKTVVQLCQDAWTLEKEGYWEEATRIYRRAAFAGGFDPNVCYRLGRALFLLGDYSAARERFYSVLERDPDYIGARVELGKTFAALGELENAKDSFIEAAQILPQDAELRVELGKLYLRLENRADAAREFQRAIELIDDQRLAGDIERLLLTLSQI